MTYPCHIHTHRNIELRSKLGNRYLASMAFPFWIFSSHLHNPYLSLQNSKEQNAILIVNFKKDIIEV